MDRRIVKKWKDIIESLLFPYEINKGMIPIIAEYLEECIEKGIDYQNKLMEFKGKLLDDEKFKIDVERTYFHKTENCIVYELSNGDSVYIENKPIVVKDNENVNSLNDLFNSVINKKEE